jgi:hypothetical protein
MEFVKVAVGSGDRNSARERIFSRYNVVRDGVVVGQIERSKSGWTLYYANGRVAGLRTLKIARTYALARI